MSKKIWVWFIIALMIASILSLFASEHPDGYEKAGEEIGFIEKATNYFSAPLSDYTIPGMESTMSGSFAGIIGVILTFSLFILLGKVLGKRNN